MSGLRKLQDALYFARLEVEGNLRVRFPVIFRRAILSCACCFAMAAVAPGQFAVIYDGKLCLGGGIIQ